MLKQAYKLTALALVLIIFPLSVNAQAEYRAFLSPPELVEFPRITSYLDVRDSHGFFIPGLPSGAVTLLEDSVTIPGEINEQRPGAQLVLAVNPGTSFVIRDLEGNSRFDYVYQALGNWISTQLEPDVDALSLVSPSGVLASQMQDPRVVQEVWSTYAVEEGTVPGPEVLSVALDAALVPPPKPGMGKAVLLITTAMRPDSGEALKRLADQAAQANVRVYVILVDSQAVFDTEPAEQLRNLTVQTGGQFFTFSNNAPLPDFQQLFESVRRTYQLEYHSQVNVSGEHTISAVVNTEAGEILSQQINYELQLSPPNPIFVALPAEITRQIPDEAPISTEFLAPRQFTFEILTDFPDGYSRSIVRTAIFVDGQMAAENLQPPFDRITLDLSAIETDRLMQVRIEATDEIGLTGSTIQTPVQISIVSPQRGLISMLAQNVTIVAAGVVILTGGVLMLVLVLAGRLQPRPLGERRRKRAAEEDPVTQPVAVVPDTEAEQINVFSRLSRTLISPKLPWPQRSLLQPEPLAYLIQISEEGDPDPDATIEINQQEVFFGSDAGKAEVVLEDPAVEPRHSRLWQDESGVFHVADLESVAGTWLNYAPVSSSGSPVEHGDLIHVGKLGFRFTLSRPTHPRRPVVINQNKGNI